MGPDDATGVHARRRLPTKTRSGLITLPLPGCRDEQPRVAGLPDVDSPVSISLLGASCSVMQQEQDIEHHKMQIEHSQPSLPPLQQSEQQAPGISLAQQTSRQSASAVPQALKSSLNPQAKASLRAQPRSVALPAQRRGSYQSLKRQAQADGRDRLNQQLFTAERPTHWERYGVVALLLCGSKQDDEALQILLAEGYEVRIVESQQEASHLLAEMETLPDLVLIDADQPFNTLRLIEQVAAANVTVATVVLASPMVRPDAVSALLAGAADHMRKPLDMDELVARVGRHVQRQHSIKNSRARGGDSSTSTTTGAGGSGAASSTASGAGGATAGTSGGQQGSGVGPPPASSYLSQRSTVTSKAHMRLASVVEDDYEETLAHVQEQMDELSRENQRLTSELAAAKAQLLALQTGGASSRGGSFSAASPSQQCRT